MRHPFGGDAASVLWKVVGGSTIQVLSGVSVTFYTARTGGTQITDLKASDGTTSITSVTSNADGSLPVFYGPDGTTQMWATATGMAERLSVSATDQASTYAVLSAGRPASRCVFLGDSLTIGNSSQAGINGAATTVIADCWPAYAAMLTGQRLRYVANAGIGGNTTAQMLARFSTDVTPYAPNVVVILAGTNDTGGGVSLATFSANIKALVSDVRGIPAIPVLATMPPNSTGTPANRKALITQYNAWLRRYAEQQGIMLLDFYGQAVDPTNGNYLASYGSTDGTHPGAAGYAAWGSYAATQLNSVLPLSSPPIAQDANDPNNLVSNGLLETAGGGGFGAQWGAYGALPTGAAASLVTDANVAGQMQKVTNTGTTSDSLFYTNVSAGFSPGDKLLFTGIVTASGVGCDLQINFNGSTGVANAKPFGLTKDITRGRWYLEFTIPSGTTSMDLLFYARAGTGSVQVGQVSCYNLTTLGIDAI